MKLQKKSIISIVLCLFLLISSTGGIVSALSYVIGGTINGHAITAVDNRTLSDGVTYSSAKFTDTKNEQIFTYEFNPKTSDYMPYVYSRYTGTGATVLSTMNNAEAQFETDVVAGINATFYATATGSTYAGYWVHDGRLAQASAGLQNDIITWTSQGDMKIVNSKLLFDVYLNDVRIDLGGSSALEHINKKSASTNVSDKFYYWDTECGTKTDSVINGTEILCEKLDGNELVIGGTLRGKIKEIRKNTFNTSVGANEFIIYVKNGSPLQDKIADVAVNDILSVSVKEGIAASAQYTEKANAAIVAQYKMIENGEYKPTAETTGLDHYAGKMNQRCGLGIKADGTIILVATGGRNQKVDGSGVDSETAPYGFTIPELGAMMLEMGCVTAFNLDGGGSTQSAYDNGTSIQYAIKSPDGTNGRAVANCILIAKKGCDPAPLSTTISKVKGIITTPQAISTVAEAEAIVATPAKYMQGDVIRVNQKLNAILKVYDDLDKVIADSIKEIGKSNFSETAWTNLWKTYESVIAVKNNVNSTVEQLQSASFMLHEALSNSGSVKYLVTKDKPYEELLKHYSSTENYGDSGGELTNGIISTIDSAYGPEWVAFSRAKTVSGKMIYDGSEKNYYDVIVDLGSVTSNLMHFNAHTEYLLPAGIDYCAAVEYSVSDNKTSWTVAGTVASNPAVVVGNTSQNLAYPLDLTTGVSGRYVRFRFIAAGDSQFIFVTEIQAFTFETPTSDINRLDFLKPQTSLNDLKTFFNSTTLTLSGGATMAGTGKTFTIAGNTYTIILKGDLNGDGKISTADYAQLKKHIMKPIQNPLTEAVKQAALNINGSKISASSYVMLKSYLLGKTELFN